MKISTTILLLALPLVTATRAADDLSPILQKALFEEEANHNLPAAIQAYEAVVTGADAQRKLAATAVFRLGECYRKLGRTNDAVAQYQRVLDQFGDQTNLVTLSRQNLAGLGVSTERARGRGMLGMTVPELLQAYAAQNAFGGPAEPTAGQVEAHRLLLERLELEIKTAEAEVAGYKQLIQQTAVPENSADKAEARLLDLRRQLILARDAGPAGADGAKAARPNLSPAARAQLKELLDGELRIAKELLAEQKRRIEVGTLAPGEDVRFERDVLDLKRQIVAIDGLSTADSRKQYRELLQQAINLAENAADIEKKKLDVGKSTAGEVARLQRDVFALKRELVTFDATPAATPSGVGSRETAATDEEEKEVRRIQALIKDSPDLVNAKRTEVGVLGSTRYGTPLHKAAQQGQLVVARFLIDNGADVDFRDGFGRAPLHWAALNGHKSMAELLLARGADPNAGVSGSANAGSSGFTPLHFAAQNGYRNVCEALLAGKADVNARTEGDRITPLHFAAERGFNSVAELLLAKGADVNARTASGSTPLMFAAGAGMKGAVQLLLAHKADINAQNAQGGTALHSAVSGDHDEVVRLLLAGKADPNLALKEKSQTPRWTPLAVAVNQGDAPTARLLLENGADPNIAIYRNGFTALMQAAQSGAVELVEALVSAGADVNARDNGDIRATALYYVTSNNPTNAAAIVEFLLKSKADVNASDVNGNAPLINAVSRRNMDVAKLLIEHGADVNAMNRGGESPLSLIKPARQQGYGSQPVPSLAPPGAIPRAVPSRSIRGIGAPGVPGQPEQPPSDPTSEIIALLEQRGARDDLQRLNAISTSRNQENRTGWFHKGTNDWNNYTLLELIAWINPGRMGSSLIFPDLSRLAIGRIDPKTARTTDFRVDLTTALTNNDCTRDLPLQWGDVVDIPEQDHFVDVGWDRYPDAYYQTFQKCLTRTVRVTIKGQSTNVTLMPFRKSTTPLSPGINPWEARMGNFRLNQFLRGSGLLLTSSDVARVKVKRRDPATKEIRERVVNLDQIQQQVQRNDFTNDLWLRDGDEIEVPEKDANRAAVSPEEPPAQPPRSIERRVVRPPLPLKE